MGTARQLLKSLALRLVYGLLSLLFVAFVTFVAGEFAPGDAALARVGEKASREAYLATRKEMGLDRPWPVRFVDYVAKASHGDFGNSWLGTKEPIGTIIGRGLKMTGKIALLAILLATIVGVTLGTVAAVYENRLTDRFALSVSTLGVTVPNFVLGPLLVLVFHNRLGVLPDSYDPQLRFDEYWYLIIPVVIMAARPMATLARLTRASMVDTLRQEFVRLAVAKGVPPFRLYVVHALRNAVLPVLTSIGTSFGILLTGSFITESFYAMPGLGYYAINAIKQRDTPLILATVLVTGALFVLVNLIVDLLLPLVDPRIRESQV
ncbi:MAG: ABC transporter permease [Armatimonadetes bacterium]|nr:ABC transporter permease [Armatimonadota bacterium]